MNEERQANASSRPIVVKEVFRGHAEECFRHFSQILAKRLAKGSHQASKIKDPIADSCGVTFNTLNRWLNQGDLPVGEQLIKLICFLDAIGYKVIELERAKPAMRRVMQLIGFSLITGPAATAEFSFAAPSSLYRILIDAQGTTEAKEQAMWDFWKKHKEELARAQEKSQQIFLALGLIQNYQTPEKESSSRIFLSLAEAMNALLSSEYGPRDLSLDSAEGKAATSLIANLTKAMRISSSGKDPLKETENGRLLSSGG